MVIRLYNPKAPKIFMPVMDHRTLANLKTEEGAWFLDGVLYYRGGNGGSIVYHLNGQAHRYEEQDERAKVYIFRFESGYHVEYPNSSDGKTYIGFVLPENVFGANSI